jgi:WD40 repeat protein
VCVLQELAHRDQVSSLAFSPDGLSLASGSYREIKIWRRDPEKIVPVEGLPDREEPPLASGSLQFVAGQSTSVVVSDPGGMPKFTLQHGNEVIAAAASNDSRRYATAAKDGTLKVWDESGKLLATVKGNRFLNEAVGVQERSLQVESANVTTAKTAVADAEKFVETSKERLRKAENESKVKQDAVSEKEGALKKLKDAKETVAAPTPADAALTAAEEALQKAFKALETAKIETTLSKAESEKAVLEVQDAKVRLTEADQARKAAEERLATARTLADAAVSPLEQVVFSPNGLYVAGRDAKGILYTWAARNGMPVNVLGDSKATQIGEPLRFVSDGMLSSGEGQGAVVWDIRSQWKLAHVIGASAGNSPLADRVCALSFSPDSKSLASGGGEPSRGGEIFIWDAASGTLVKEIKRAHVDTVLALEFSPDGKTLLTGSADRMARQIDVEQGTILKTFEGHTGHVLAVSWSLDGKQVATAGGDNVAKVWAVDTGLRKRNIDGYDKEVTGVRFLGASLDVLTSSGDNKVRAVGVDGKEIRSFSEPGDFVQGLAVRRDATRAVGGGGDGVLREWAVETGKVESRFGP